MSRPKEWRVRGVVGDSLKVSPAPAEDSLPARVQIHTSFLMAKGWTPVDSLTEVSPTGARRLARVLIEAAKVVEAMERARSPKRRTRP